MNKDGVNSMGTVAGAIGERGTATILHRPPCPYVFRNRPIQIACLLACGLTVVSIAGCGSEGALLGEIGPEIFAGAGEAGSEIGMEAGGAAMCESGIAGGEALVDLDAAESAGFFAQGDLDLIRTLTAGSRDIFLTARSFYELRSARLDLLKKQLEIEGLRNPKQPASVFTFDLDDRQLRELANSQRLIISGRDGSTIVITTKSRPSKVQADPDVRAAQKPIVSSSHPVVPQAPANKPSVAAKPVKPQQLIGNVTVVDNIDANVFGASFDSDIHAKSGQRFLLYRITDKPERLGYFHVLDVRDHRLMGACEGFLPKIGDRAQLLENVDNSTLPSTRSG
jgi:hypothetical protein